MLRKQKILSFFLFLALLTICMPSCKTGEGCAATEHYEAKSNKDGVLSKKKGRSSLFSKKQKKRMKKKRG